MDRTSRIKDMDVGRELELLAAEAVLKRCHSEKSDRYGRRRQKRRTAVRIAVVVAVLAVIACSVHANRRDSATVGISDNQAEQINRNILGIK